MKLTSEHKEAVATWVAAGATLNEIQDRLKNELGVTLTFMDTRFLLSDLGLTLKPEAGEGIGNEVSWLTSDVVNGPKFDCKALVK